MERQKRKKMCLHCEGEVDLDVIVCPYCGKDVSDQKIEADMSKQPFAGKTSTLRAVNNSDETIASLYPPPYQPKEQALISQEKTVINNSEDVLAEEPAAEEKLSALSVILFSLGINLLLVGLFSFVFSSHGEIWLHWKSHWWLVYLLFSAPLLVVGFKKMG